MIIDCDGCSARPHACSDCVVTVLLGMPQVGGTADLDAAEQTAVGVLAAAGLVPPLRLVEPATYDASHAGGSARAG